MRELRVVLWAFVVGFASACGSADGRDEVPTDSSYVEVMAQLVRVGSQITTRDSVRGDSARRAVLREHDVETSQLIGYAELYGEDAAHMMEIWTAINQRVLELDSLAREEEAREEEARERKREEERLARDTLATGGERE